MAYDHTEGIPLENLNEYIEMLKDVLKLDQAAVDSFKTLRFTRSKEQLVHSIKVEEGVSSSYGYIMMSKDTATNTVSCAYAVHSMELKLADRTVRTTRTKHLWFIPIGEEVDISTEKGTSKIVKYRFPNCSSGIHRG